MLDDPGSDTPYLADSLRDHRRRFGKPPWLVAGDRGVSSPANETLAKDAGGSRIVLPAKGRVSPERQQQERQRWFQRGFRFRAGIEGRIGVLQRSYGLDRCPNHGKAGLEGWVGWGIVTANLVKIAETVASRPARQERSAA